MLARHYTLKNKNDFERIKDEGKIYQSKSFAVSYLRQDSPAATSRFGFVVSTKISKKASIRNRARRVMSDGVRFCCTEVKEGYDCVFLAKPVIVKTYTSDLIREVREALGNIGLIKK